MAQTNKMNEVTWSAICVRAEHYSSSVCLSMEVNICISETAISTSNKYSGLSEKEAKM
jgi:hypothetical protein